MPLVFTVPLLRAVTTSLVMLAALFVARPAPACVNVRPARPTRVRLLAVKVVAEEVPNPFSISMVLAPANEIGPTVSVLVEPFGALAAARLKVTLFKLIGVVSPQRLLLMAELLSSINVLPVLRTKFVTPIKVPFAPAADSVPYTCTVPDPNGAPPLMLVANVPAVGTTKDDAPVNAFEAFTFNVPAEKLIAPPSALAAFTFTMPPLIVSVPKPRSPT